jgi:hydroxymethylbilane synthase
LSRAQVEELFGFFPGVNYQPIWTKTTGDLDKVTSLRSLDKTDFFTRELDQMLLAGEVDIAVHSAKDLPDPIPQGLKVIAYTKGVDPSDSLVLREGETLQAGFRIATSSVRREDTVKSICDGLTFMDLRGTIQERLAKLDRFEADGIVVAEAALIRLKLTHLNRIRLPGTTAAMQGRLAILTRADNHEMQTLFSTIHDDTLPRS